MIYQTTINGLPVTAQYSEASIETIYLPLLNHLTRLQKEKHRRILVMLAAPPAAGKSTTADFLEHLSQTTEGLTPITVIGMDGFHRYQDYLLTHTIMRDGKEITMVDVKGTPETFDLPKLTHAINRVAAGDICGWPTYDRTLHNPTEDAIQVTGDIVLLEGNYLLLDQPGWRDLKQYADYTIRIDAVEEDLKNRLVERKLATGVAREKAEAFVEFSDLYNARLVLTGSMPADLILTMDAAGEYYKEGK